MAGKCKKCGKNHLPPRPLCDKCLNQEFNWIEISKKGKLLTFSTIYVAPNQFQKRTPYSVGIIELERELKIPGMIVNISEKELNIGMTLKLDFQTCRTSDSWPQWPRYYFGKP